MADDQEKQDAEYGLVLPFKDQSPEFARGFECGQIWELFKKGQPFTTCFNADNQEQVESMCRRFVVTYFIRDWAPGWLQLQVFPFLHNHN